MFDRLQSIKPTIPTIESLNKTFNQKMEIKKRIQKYDVTENVYGMPSVTTTRQIPVKPKLGRTQSHQDTNELQRQEFLQE